MPDSSLFLYYANFITDYNMKTLPLLFFIFFPGQSVAQVRKKIPPHNRITEKKRQKQQYSRPLPSGMKEKNLSFLVEENYPETNIRLSDLSDALYIPLETNDSTLLRQIGTCEGNEYLLTNDFIYAQEEQAAIYIFKRDGSLVRKIDHKGGGPGEYQLYKQLCRRYPPGKRSSFRMPT